MLMLFETSTSIGIIGSFSSVNKDVKTGFTKKMTRERKAIDLKAARINRFDLEANGKHFLYTKKEKKINAVAAIKPHNPTSSTIFLTASYTAFSPYTNTGQI